MTENAYTPVPRLIARNNEDRFRIVAVGGKRAWIKDVYANMLGASWKNILLGICFFYFLTNLAFGLGYFISGGIENARANSFADAFFFSVQTFATIGYGKMAPSGLFANILVTLEALLGFAFYAVMTGLVFSKFSRPTARVLFSNVAVICPYNGTPHLMIRLANERHNKIVDATAHAVLLRDETSNEGQSMRRFYDLSLVRSRTPILQLTWTVMHPIDEKSPLFNISEDTLKKYNMEVIVSLTGLDETFSQTIHARNSYVADEILCDHTFVDVLTRKKNKEIEINYDLFHSVVRISPTA